MSPSVVSADRSGRIRLGTWIAAFGVVGYLVAGDTPFSALGIGPATPYLPAALLLGFALAGLAVRGPRAARSQRTLRTLLLLMAALGAYLALSLVYSHGGTYAITKVVQFWAFAWLGAFLSGLVADSAEGLTALATAFLVSGLALGGIGIATVFLGSAETQLAVLGGGPNVYVRLMMFGVLSGVLLFATPGGRGTRTACLVGAVLLIVPLLLSGSRGGLIAALVAAGIVLAVPWHRFAEVRRAKAAVLLLLAVGVTTYFLLKLAPATCLPTAISRYNAMVSDLPGGMSVAARREAARLAWSMFLQSPVWGHGVGSFSTHSALGYPHNVVLELLSETGLLGLSVFLAMCLAAGLPLLRLLRSTEPPIRATAVWLLGMLAFIGAAAQVSGDLYATRYLFAFLGMAAGLAAHARRSRNEGMLMSKCAGGSHAV